MSNPRGQDPHLVGVTQRGVSEGAEADELARVYHLAYTNAVTHSKNMDHLLEQQMANQNFASGLSQLAAVGHGVGRGGGGGREAHRRRRDGRGPPDRR